ncbi:MAG: L-threonylcarbamoyladenylate synthase [Pyrinomonadaceae bacterium]
MKTVLTSDVSEAAEFIRQGGIVAFPTETVYGLGANVFDEAAVAKIFDAKKRPADNPLIAHVASVEQIAELTTSISPSAHLFIAAFFPGPLTVVLPRSARVPTIATAGLDTIGVRMPRYSLAHEFLAACAVPVVAPSANLSGRPSPTTWQAVQEDLGGRIDCILQGDATEIGLESTVVDCTGDVPMLLRQGAVSLDELRIIVPETVEYKQVENDSPRSPGLKHRHYSPSADVLISNLKFEISDFCRSAFIGKSRPEHPFELIKECSSTEEYAHSVFEFFRECDRLGIRTIYCEGVPETGIGAALMDRLRRAAKG